MIRRHEGPLGILHKKQTHRELMYDPQHSTRRFKRFMRATTSGHWTYMAYTMGQCSIVANDVPTRWKSNPFRRGGRRWQAYEDGRNDAMEERHQK